MLNCMVKREKIASASTILCRQESVVHVNIVLSVLYIFDFAINSVVTKRYGGLTTNVNF